MQENSGIKQQFPKTEFFRMDSPGVYRLRILPLAPNRDGSLDSGKFGYTFRHRTLMYALDLNNRSKGILLLILNRSQFMDLEAKRSKLWQPALAKNPYAACPVSSVYSAFPVEIEKRKSGSRIEYIISIDDKGECDALTPEELNALMEAPRLMEVAPVAILNLPEEHKEEGGCEDDLPF